MFRQLITSVLAIVLLVGASMTAGETPVIWVEPKLPPGLVAWNDLVERQLLDPGEASDEAPAEEQDEEKDDDSTYRTPVKSRAYWVNTRCYPNTPNRKPNYSMLGGAFSRQHGWIPARRDVDGAIEVDQAVMAVYRDVLSASVRAVDIWMLPDNSNPCGYNVPVWVSMGSAIALHRVGNQIIWATADHISYLEDYTNFSRGALQIHGTDAISLPRQPDFRIGILITPPVPGVIPLTSLFGTYYNDNLPALFYPVEDLIVGQRVYQAFTTLGYDCLPTIVDIERCVVTYPQVNVGTISAVIPTYGEMGSTYTAQLDIMGGASGSPTFVFYDNGDGLINGADFRMVGVANTGWTSGNGGFQGITWDDFNAVVQYIEAMESLWK